jgi:hypothetical protein
LCHSAKMCSAQRSFIHSLVTWFKAWKINCGKGRNPDHCSPPHLWRS